MNRRLRVNPIACDAHGLCAELLPELVRLDEWGYPIVSSGPVPARLLKHARRAVSACPTLALLLEEAEGARSGASAAKSREGAGPGRARPEGPLDRGRVDASTGDHAQMRYP